MYEQPTLEMIPFYMLYAVDAVIAMIASCYLLFRRGNAFAPDITTPIRLRRWTAAFFASIALSHLWYLPLLFLTSSDDVELSYFVGALLDCMIVLPLAIIVLFSMLQDRRRPLWPVAVMIAPLVVGVAWCIVSRSDAFFPVIHVYLLLLGIGLIIYMVCEVRRYGRWLRDNYVDLEHKEVWQTFVVLAIILLFSSFYVSGLGGTYYKYIIRLNDVVLVCYLLWRVETLSDLSIAQPLSSPVVIAAEVANAEAAEGNGPSETIQDNIGLLLQQFCIGTQLFLQHDLTVGQLAKVIGTNRLYLSNYFSSQGLTYNAYINNLRINHFVNLYHEAVATQRFFTVHQLAHDSGYRSYSTFSLAFKQRMGQSVTAWMHDSGN